MRIELDFSEADIDVLWSTGCSAGKWQERGVMFWDGKAKDTFDAEKWERGCLLWTDQDAGGFIGAKILAQAHIDKGIEAHLMTGEHYDFESSYYGCWVVWVDYPIDNRPLSRNPESERLEDLL